MNWRPCSLAIGAFTALSVVFLSWSMAFCLRGVFRAPANKAHRLTLFVSGSSQKDNETAVESIFADGSTLRKAQMRLEGIWNFQEFLVHPNTTDRASLSFYAKSAVVLLDKRWHCGHLKISDESGTLWKDSCSRHDDSVTAVELPRSIGSHWPFVGWFFVFLVVAAIIKPWKNDRRAGWWLVFYLMVLQFLVWSMQSVGIDQDSSVQFSTLRINLQGWPGVYAPGYPFLVGIGYLVSATSAGAVITFLQHGFMVVTIWWCFRLLGRCVGTALSFLTALVMGASAATLMLPQDIMSENVALFGMVGTLYFAVRYMERARLRDAIVAGALLGWAALARVAPLTAEIPAIFILMLGSETVAVGVRRTALISGIALLFVILPALWFLVRSGSFALVNDTGPREYDRVVYQQHLLDVEAPATSRFLRLIDRDPYDRWWNLAHVLESEGLSWSEMSSMMEQVSLEGIRMAPWKYVGYSFEQAWRQYFDDPSWWLMWLWRSFIPSWSNLPANDCAPDAWACIGTLDSPPVLGIHANALSWRHRLDLQFQDTWRFLPWLALLGIVCTFFLRDRLLFLAIAVVLLGYVLSAAFAEFEQPRLNLVNIPLYFCLATGPFAAVQTFFTNRM